MTHLQLQKSQMTVVVVVQVTIELHYDLVNYSLICFILFTYFLGFL